MSDLFEKAIEKTLAHEGGFVNDPVDPGGATNWGVSIRFLRQEIKAKRIELADVDIDDDGDLDADDMKAMTRDQAVEIYRSAFWERYKYESYSSGEVAIKVFDFCVNMGPRQAHKLLQRALNQITGSDLVVDGLVGSKTHAVFDEAVKDYGSQVILGELRAQAARFYLNLIALKPDMAKYRRGWLRRAYST